MFSKFSIVLLALSLMSCTPREVMMQELKVCKQHCAKQYFACRKHCKNNYAHCYEKRIVTAKKTHRRFVHEMAASGGIVSRELQSYLDPLQCTKITCSCTADHANCTQACRGNIG